MTVDRAVHQVTQCPHGFVEHCRRADDGKIADEAAGDAVQRAQTRPQKRLFRQPCAVNDQRVDDGGNQRRNRRALYAQRGEAAQTEDEQRVEYDVHRNGNQRSGKRYHDVARALQQRAAAARQREERVADGDDAQIGRAQRNRFRIGGEQTNDRLRKQQSDEHEQRGRCLRADGHQAVCPMDARGIVRTVILRDEHGRAACKAKKDDG